MGRKPTIKSIHKGRWTSTSQKLKWWEDDLSLANVGYTPEDIVALRERTWQKLLDQGLVSDKRTGERARTADGVSGVRGHYQKPQTGMRRPRDPDSKDWVRWVTMKRMKDIVKQSTNEIPHVRRKRKRKGFTVTPPKRLAYMREYMRKRREAAKSDEYPNC